MAEITLLDGACGTFLWEKAAKKLPVWQYNLVEPDIVADVHRAYAEAGSEIVLANTFSANELSMRNTPYTVEQIVPAGVELARQGAGGKATVGLDIGPLPILLEPYGDLEEDEAFAIYDRQIRCGVQARPDLILLETFLDVEMLKVAVRAAAQFDLPIFCSMSFEAVGKTMMGNSVRDMVETLADLPVVALGLNCSLGPQDAAPLMRQFRDCTDLPLLFKPNAGKPVPVDGELVMEFDPDTFVADCLPALDAGVRYIGGCCGTSPDYIRKLKAALQAR